MRFFNSFNFVVKFNVPSITQTIIYPLIFLLLDGELRGISTSLQSDFLYAFILSSQNV